jgi:hypothetical protein
MSVSFVLGGGGRWGAVEVGMLTDVGITPDTVVGASVGVVNENLPDDDDVHFSDSNALTGGARDATSDHLASIRG